jgi:predicted DNA-binding transcriptional regulator AlpA
MASTPARLILTPEAAPLFGVKPQTARLWRTQGRGPEFIRLGGPRGRVAYSAEAIQRWRDSRTLKSTCDPGPQIAAPKRRGAK